MNEFTKELIWNDYYYSADYNIFSVHFMNDVVNWLAYES